VSTPLDSVAVIGAGPAGVAVCEELRELGYDGRIVLYGGENRLPYDRPPLSKEFLLGTVAESDLLLRPVGWYADHGVEFRQGLRVRRLLPDEGRTVDERGREERVDAIVLATGAAARRTGSAHPAVGVLRTVGDAEALRARMGPGARLTVVGAGLIGAEVAAAGVALGCAVTLIDPEPLPLIGVVGKRIAAFLREQHETHGVSVLASALAGIEGRGPAAAAVLADGRVVEGDAVVLGLGAVPETALAQEAGLAVDRGVLVDAAQRSSCPRIFAVGDLARPVGEAGAATGHWAAAVAQARAAARALLGKPSAPRPAPWFWSDRYGTRLEVAGEFTGADSTVLRGTLEEGDFCALALRGGRCVGAVTVGRSQEMAAARRLIERRVPVAPHVVADGSVGLRSLLRTR
jgi:3-phenylpropionate/trans-cinnamate dioxygenase ferredoxin reductase subunit